MVAQKPRVIAVVPARGGSVSIPKKNIKELLGRPLIDWVIKPAIDSGIFTDIYVSTDDDEIAAKALACGAKVHRRAAHTAAKNACRSDKRFSCTPRSSLVCCGTLYSIWQSMKRRVCTIVAKAAAWLWLAGVWPREASSIAVPSPHRSRCSAAVAGEPWADSGCSRR